ncbi:hypothetical protein BD311DRAFT_352376 [Dichomitus squalens]|uniref:Uncharacterized protein n=1 Tax=Dichomitus squalens TaxID=114155 RepID=A0A4Q9N2H1_9APHY|nr:hypothetical protein BD311DRAFT_352376 [Dichomitus squalens]
MGDCTYSGDSWSLRFPCLRRAQSGGSRAYLRFARGGYPHRPFRRSLLAMSICFIYRQHRNVNPVVPVPFLRFLGLLRRAWFPRFHCVRTVHPSHASPVRRQASSQDSRIALPRPLPSVHCCIILIFTRICTLPTHASLYQYNSRVHPPGRPPPSNAASAKTGSCTISDVAVAPYAPSSPQHPSYAQHIHDMRSLGASHVGSSRQADGGVDGQSADDCLGATGWRRARG